VTVTRLCTRQTLLPAHHLDLALAFLAEVVGDVGTAHERSAAGDRRPVEAGLELAPGQVACRPRLLDGLEVLGLVPRDYGAGEV
jgi:hypothetical protein